MSKQWVQYVEHKSQRASSGGGLQISRSLGTLLLISLCASFWQATLDSFVHRDRPDEGSQVLPRVLKDPLGLGAKMPPCLHVHTQAHAYTGT